MKRLLVLAAIGALALAGCTNGSDDEAGDDADDTTTTEADEETTTTEADEAGGEETTTTESSGSASGDCPVGTWEISEEQVQAQYDEFGATSGFVFQGTGSLELDLAADGTFTYSPKNFVLSFDAAGSTTAVTLGGSVGGTYTADGGILKLVVTSDALEVAVTANGVEVDPSQVFGDDALVSDVPFEDSPYRCENGTLVIDMPGVDGQLIETVLTPV